MPVEAPVQPTYEAASPPPEPVDYASRYGGIGATTDPEGDLPAQDAAVGFLPPPDVTSTTTTSDFESRYADIGMVPGTEATTAELDPTPTPAPTPLPEFADRYADIGSTPAAAKALDETPQPATPLPVEPPFVIQSAAQIEAGDVKLVRERGPLVPIPKAEITQAEPILAKGAKATYNAVAGLVEGATSADGLNMLLNPVVGVTGLGSMVVDMVQRYRNVVSKTPPGSPERYQFGADVTAFLALPAVIHGVSKLRTPARPVDSSEPAPATVTPEVQPPQTETARVAPAVPEKTISQPATGGGEILTETAVPQGAADLPENLPRAREVMPAANESASGAGLSEAEIKQTAQRLNTIPEAEIREAITLPLEELTRKRIEVQSALNKAISQGQDLGQISHAGFQDRLGLYSNLEIRAGSAPEPVVTSTKNAVTPTLRAGEKQGDLLSTQTEDLALVGEKGIDYGARQTAAEKAAQAAEEARLKQESQQQLLKERYTLEADTGDELLTAIAKAGGLPAKSSKYRQFFKGELDRVDEAVRNPMSKKQTVSPNAIFRKDAPDLDELTTRLRGKGFDFETPNDLLNAVENRMFTDRPHYPTPPQTAGQETFGFGPGAAAAEEALPKSEPRAFAERFQDDAAIAQEIRDAAGNRFYEPISNKITMENALDVVQERGIPESINMLKDEANGLDFRVRSAMGQFIIKRLNEGYRALKESAPADAELFLNQTADLAEWQQEYGTRLGQGVQSFAMWSRITPEGKLLSLKRQIQTVRDKFTQENGDQVKAVIAAANTGKIDVLRQLAKKNPIARKLKNQFKDLIEASQPQLLTEDGFYQVAGERLGIPTFSPKIAADVLKLAHEIEAAPEGMPRDKATLELSKYIANLKGFDAKDVPLGIYYGNMLSGYNTQFVNALDTFLNVSSEITSLAVTNPKAAMKIYGGLLRGFGEGRLDALLALTEGRMITDGKWLEVPKLMEVAKFGEKGGVPIRVTGTGSRLIKAASESKVAYPLRGWKYVTRLMAASDAIMFRGAKEARMALLADRLARGEGLRGRALTNRVNEILGLDEPALRSAQEQARAEGFTGTKAKVRAAELREMARPKEASADAADFAGEATYNHEPHGVGGFFADLAAKASTKFPVLKAFVPFTRIVANVTNRGLNYTPVGFKRAFYGYSGEAAPLGDARAAMLTRATMGTVAMGTMLALQESGALEVHGAGPSDNERRKQLQNAGWKPYSIKVGDHYFSYVYTPAGLGLSILGNMTDSYRYNELSQKDAFTRAGYAISRIGSTVFNQSFLSGLSGLFRALSGSPGDTIASVKQTLSSTFGSFTTPTILRDIYRLFDPKVYQTTSIVGDLLKNTPFAAAVNKPALNAFGESVSYPSNRFVSEVKDDAAWRFIVEKGLRVPVPDKYSQVPDGDGGKRRITPDEYYRYLHDSGQQIKAAVLDKRFEWATLDHDEAQKELNSESERIREQVKRELFQ